MQISFLEQASLWGQVFEIAVKRGVLQKLIHEKLLVESHPVVENWQKFQNIEIKNKLIKSLKITDQNTQEWVESMLRHLLVLGYGLGWTTTRECLKKECLKKTPVAKLKVEAIWCPLVFPGEEPKPDVEPDKTALEFQQAFNLQGNPDSGLVKRGQPARADFLLWLSPAENSSYKLNSKKRNNFIFCFEFSYNVPRKLADFRNETAHREEVGRYARYIDSRGVFSRVCAEVEGEEFAISAKIKNHFLPFTGSDKPLYKLCQASSYTERLVTLLKSQGRLEDDCIARAIAITSNGCESIAANFSASTDTRIKLMQSLGEAYRKLPKSDEHTSNQFENETLIAFNQLVRSLPSDLKKQAKQLIQEPNLAADINYRFEENIEDFYNPNDELSRKDVIATIEETEALHEFFGGSPQVHFTQELPQTEKITLRKVHEAAVIAGLNAAQVGKINVIALEGNPGIGKTTAVMNFLHKEKQSQGFMFLYISPRVVINRDVTDKLARRNGNPSGILTLTTNANLINLAPKWCKKQGIQRFIDSAVVVDGVENLNHPDCNTKFILPVEEHEIDADIVSASKAKNSLNERDDKIESIRRPGVLRTLATSARKLLEVNPQINQLVMTAATQGYRSLDDTTTIDALSNLFKNKADTKPGIKEKLDLSKRIPTIIAMVDEVTGDGAGALFVHKLGEWLHQQFIEPFEGIKSPFKVVLILADASLSNEVVLNNYLSHNQAPDKVLLSTSRGNEPFRITVTDVKVGVGKYPTLHIMTNSYPASQLSIEYSMQLAKVTPEFTKDGIKQSIRKAIREQLEKENLDNACREIERGLKQGAEQLIFFAQDKAFLRQLRNRLIEGKYSLCKSQDVAILDQSVLPQERLKLVQEKTRDQKRVFLMTSSGSRGVSFPKTDWIIATIPRFNIESALMEVAQLIYRGRGMYTNSETGLQVSGDDKKRRLVMLINDCIIEDDIEDKERDFSSRWLRQSSDLLTLLMMLRSTIHTRIKGDAGLRKQRIAFVPVGSIGDEELLNLMSDDVQSFLQEARVFIYDHHSEENKGIVKTTQQLIEEIFAGFKLTGKAENRTTKSYVEYQTLAEFVQDISRISSQLLPNLENANVIIPENLTCLGTFWIEDWGQRKTEERFKFEAWRKNTVEKIDRLLKLLYVIHKDDKNKFPPKLRRSARELHTILKKDKEDLTQEYSTLQNLQTENMLVSIPLDYPHFWCKERPNTPKQRLAEPDSWQKALGRTLTPQGLVMPVIAKYEGIPWVAVAGRRVLNQWETIFSDRYFMASSELNLLNTILLEDDL